MKSKQEISSDLYDVIVIGGGLAGLTASIYLAKAGFRVLVFEKHQYPRHKVCGEYISNEVRPLLDYLGLHVDKMGAVPIRQFAISSKKGRLVQAKLPLGGFGMSRYAMDEALYELAIKNGVEVRFETVDNTQFKNEQFLVQTKNGSYLSKICLGSQGKRSAFDKNLNRTFMNKKSPWLGVKAHYEFADFPKSQVALHCFDGGYGGLSRTEMGTVNFCYLAHYDNFQKYGSVESFNEQVVSKNPFLEEFFAKSKLVFKNPLSIAQISFEKKSAVEEHVLMCGDSAGLIHPLCGNGMAMAIHAAKLASDCTIRFFKDNIYSRTRMEEEYQKQWNAHFSSRLYFGRKIQHLITNTTLMNSLFSILPNSQLFLSTIIKQTHGKPILV